MDNMRNTIKLIFIATISLFLFACSSSSSPTPASDGGGGNKLTGNAATGLVYYESECAVCHKAINANTNTNSQKPGDTSKTFASSDLAKNYNFQIATGNASNITLDMHTFGSARNLMGRFDTISAQNVADLEAFLKTYAAP